MRKRRTKGVSRAGGAPDGAANRASATGANSTAVGENANAAGTASTAVGCNATALADFSLAFGANALANGANAIGGAIMHRLDTATSFAIGASGSPGIRNSFAVRGEITVEL